MSTVNFISQVMAASKQPAPEVGMGATQMYYTDRHACTVVEVSKSGKRIAVVDDIATRTDNRGMTDSGQEYSYEPGNPEAKLYYTLRKNGTWVREGESMNGGTKLALGHRSHYRDFSF